MFAMQKTLSTAPLPWSDLQDVAWDSLGDSETPIVMEPTEATGFYEGLLLVSRDQLFDQHSSPELRWEILHWVFSVPFVSRDYGSPFLRAILAKAVRRFREGISAGKTFDPNTCHAVQVASLGFKEVRFRISEDFEILPDVSSFEHVCIRLDMHPEVLQERIEEGLKERGISELIEHAKMGVRPKCAPRLMEQQNFVDYDWGDIRYFIVPETVKRLVRREPRLTQEADVADRQVALF